MSSIPFINDIISLSKDAQYQSKIKALIAEGARHKSTQWAGHMTGVVDDPALLGLVISGLHNGNLLSPELYPLLEKIEAELINWFCQLFGQQHGHFTHGSSYANLEALWQARDAKKNNSIRVYGSCEAHYSIVKACQILGVEFHAIPTNTHGEMDTDVLDKACQAHPPFAIVITAGTTSSGAIDPIGSCVHIAKKYKAWSHVDAAWGGALILQEEQSDLLGINQADSACFDPHKAWGQPKPSSVLLYQNKLKSLDNISYLMKPPLKTLRGSHGGELFLPLWLTLLHEPDALLHKLENRLAEAKQFYNLLSDASDWPVFYSTTGIICFKVDTDLSALENSGLLSRSKLNNEDVYRVVFTSGLTSAQKLISTLEPYF